MNTLLLILIVYVVGFYVAYLMAASHLRKFDTHDSPFFGALLSWVFVVAFIVIFVVRFFKEQKYEKQRIRRGASKAGK